MADIRRKIVIEVEGIEEGTSELLQFEAALNETDEAVKQLNEDLGNIVPVSTITNLGDLKKNLELLEQEFDNAEFGSEQFKQLQSEIAKSKARIRELDEATDGLTSQQKIEAFAGIGEAIVGAFAVSSVLEEFVSDSELVAEAQEKIEKSLLLVQAARSISEGVKQAALLKTTIAQKLNTQATIEGTIADQAAIKVKNGLSKAFNFATKAIGPLAIAIGGLIIGFKSFSLGAEGVRAKFNSMTSAGKTFAVTLALLAIPITTIIGLFVLLREGLDLLREKFEAVDKAVRFLVDGFKEVFGIVEDNTEALKKQREETEALEEAYKNFNKALIANTAARINNNNARSKFLLQSEIEENEKIIKTYEDYNNTLNQTIDKYKNLADELKDFIGSQLNLSKVILDNKTKILEANTAILNSQRALYELELTEANDVYQLEQDILLQKLEDQTDYYSEVEKLTIDYNKKVNDLLLEYNTGSIIQEVYDKRLELLNLQYLKELDILTRQKSEEIGIVEKYGKLKTNRELANEQALIKQIADLRKIAQADRLKELEKEAKASARLLAKAYAEAEKEAKIKAGKDLFKKELQAAIEELVLSIQELFNTLSENRIAVLEQESELAAEILGSIETLQEESINKLTELENNLYESRIDNRQNIIASIDKEKEKLKELEAQKNKELAAEAKRQEEIAKIKKKQATLNKAIAIGEIIQETALAVLNAVGKESIIPPPLNLALAGIYSGIGAVQLANVVASKEFAEGGFTGKGNKYEPAGIVHKGEYVIPKWIVEQPSMKSTITNIETKRLKGYAEGGMVTNNVTNYNNDLSSLENTIKDIANRPVVVSVEAFERTSNQVKNTEIRASF